MIASLKGKVIEVSSDSAILDVHGVGYELILSLDGLSRLQDQMGKDIFVYIYTHVREDALQLFAFLTKSEKQLFLSLLKVNGVGPKMAIHLMSGAAVEQIFQMIENEDVKALSKLPRVGKKTAEQIVLTLKGKLVLSEPIREDKPVVSKEITFALVNLGFRVQDVEKVVAKLPAGLDLQEGIRQGLLALTSL